MKERKKIDLFGAVTMLVISMAVFYLKNSVLLKKVTLEKYLIYPEIVIFILGLSYVAYPYKSPVFCS